MGKMLHFKPDLCTGCEICEIVCSLLHYQEIDVKRSLIRIERGEQGAPTARYCRRCRSQACVTACDTGALLAAEGGGVQFDAELCNSCCACSEACPFGELPFKNQLPLFCDACHGAYQCVAWCPAKALVQGEGGA